MAEAAPPPLQIEAQPMVASLAFSTLYRVPVKSLRKRIQIALVYKRVYSVSTDTQNQKSENST